MGPLKLPTLREMGIAAAACVGIVACVTVAANKAFDHFYADKQDFRDRVPDVLTAKSLTLVTLKAFEKNDACKDTARPFAAQFVAKDADSKIVEGTVCIASNREAVVKIKP